MLPTISVVICSFNGEKVVGRAIESVLAQDYPRNRFEVIVINDGSTDSTAEVIDRYPVRAIHHGKNQGIAAARNTGLKNAVGEIYASFDDDCVVGPHWLRELAEGYAQPNVAGVASKLVSPHKVSGLADHYMVASGSGNPPTLKTSAKNNIITRLFTYIYNNINPPGLPTENIYRVGLISGATASFPVAVLRSVGGWDAAMSGVEDTELCHRISLAFPHKNFYAVSSAHMIHDPKLSIRQLMHRQLSRGAKNLQYYRKYGLTPPIFPFPIAWLMVSIYAASIAPAYGAISLVLVPQLLYVWWPIRSVREAKPLYLLLPYVQSAEEFAALIGMSKGLIGPDSLSSFKPLPVISLLTALWAAMTLFGPASLVMNIFTCLLLLLAPGYLILKIIASLHAQINGWKTLSYSAGLSILSLMITGLIVNTLLPLRGYQHPLSRHPLVLAITLLMFILIAVATYLKPNLMIKLSIPRLNGLELSLGLFGLILPALTVFGTIALNNNGSPLLAVTALAGVGLYAFALLWPKDGRIKHGYSLGLYSIGLSVLIASSLRGYYITGHDVMQEYQVFQLTTGHSMWSMKYYQDAYSACLSITILPTILAKLTSIFDPYIYKVTFQAVFALVPVVIYHTIQPFVSKRVAFLAAFIFISFPTFMQDMSMLGRQEIAFLCFGLAIMALLSQDFTNRQRTVMLTLLLTATVLSHYSTSYVALGAIVTGKGIEIFYRLARRTFKKSHTNSPWRPLPWTLVVVMILVTYGWNTQITQTSTSITATLRGVITSLPQLLEPQSKTGESAYSLVGAKVTSAQLFDVFTKTSTSRRDFPASEYYPAAWTDRYPIAMAQETIQPPTSFGSWLMSHMVPLYGLNDAVKQYYAKIIQLLMVIGAGILLFSKKLFRLPRQYPIMGAAFLVVIALQVLLPGGIINYGLLRLIQQGLMFLALPIVLAALAVPRLLRLSENTSLRIVTLLFIGAYGFLSGFVSSATGGYKPTLTTSNSGFYYEAYYSHADEIAAFAWLKSSIPVGSIVNADEFARRKMITYAGIFARPTMTPDTIARGSYVFLSDANTTTGKIPVYANGTLLYQTLPSAFLRANKTLVYSNDHVQIYR